MIPHNFWTKRPTIKFLTFLEWELIGLYFLCLTLEDWLLNLSVYEQSLKFSTKKMMKILQKHEKIRRTWVKYLNKNCFEEPKVCTFGKALRFFEANFFGTILIFHQCAFVWDMKIFVLFWTLSPLFDQPMKQQLFYTQQNS